MLVVNNGQNELLKFDHATVLCIEAESLLSCVHIINNLVIV